MNPYFLGGVALFAFVSGWSVNDWRHDAKVKKAQDRVRAEEQVKLDGLRTALDAANSKRLSLAADLAAAKSNIKVKYKTITQEVPVYAPKNSPSCNYDLDPGLVRLLNTAASGATGYPASAVSTAGQLSFAVPGQSDTLAGKPIRQPN